MFMENQIRNNTYGCPDADFDGWADDQDHFPRVKPMDGF